MFLIKHFVASAIHLGHKTNQWNPCTASFLFAVKGDTHLIDLELTIPMLRRAPDLVKKIYEKRGSILYIGVGSAPQPETNFDQKPSIQQTTNLAIEGAIEDRGPELPQIPHGGGLGETHPAAYAGSSQRRKVLAELSRGSRGGVWPIPEALSILNVNDNSILIKEAMKLQLSVIGIIDSDTNPFGIQYPIPGNDDSVESLAVYTNLLHNAIADAKKNELTKICSS